MIKNVICGIKKRYGQKTDVQKAYLCIAVSFMTYYFFYLSVKKAFTFLYVIPLIYFVKAFIYWQPIQQRKINPIIKKIIFIMFISWLTLLIIELSLRLTGNL